MPNPYTVLGHLVLKVMCTDGMSAGDRLSAIADEAKRLGLATDADLGPVSNRESQAWLQPLKD